jgi:hypothetical protein
VERNPRGGNALQSVGKRSPKNSASSSGQTSQKAMSTSSRRELSNLTNWIDDFEWTIKRICSTDNTEIIEVIRGPYSNICDFFVENVRFKLVADSVYGFDLFFDNATPQLLVERLVSLLQRD